MFDRKYIFTNVSPFHTLGNNLIMESITYSLVFFWHNSCVLPLTQISGVQKGLIVFH